MQPQFIQLGLDHHFAADADHILDVERHWLAWYHELIERWGAV